MYKFNIILVLFPPPKIQIKALDIPDNAIWTAVRENKVRSLKAEIGSGHIDVDGEVIAQTKRTLAHLSVVHNKIEILTLILLYGGKSSLYLSKHK